MKNVNRKRKMRLEQKNIPEKIALIKFNFTRMSNYPTPNTQYLTPISQKSSVPREAPLWA